MPNKSPTLESLTTVNEDGSRLFIHPADVRGTFTTLRRIFGWLLIAVYALLPWIPVGGYPAVFLDVENARFHFFGLTIVANDLWILFFLISGLAFSLFFVTALTGRVWCGWACPQTVFLDHVFRRIERFIEGDAQKRRALDEESWSMGKAVKRVIKHAIFLVLSLAISHMLLAYFISIPRLYELMGKNPFDHLGQFAFVYGFGLVLYGNFAWFREQFCIILCPYGRFQSALIDDDSIVIGYDEKRGEPRGKATDPSNGDCIDCHRCVQVCPTGIDIRQGLQMECIACSNCIDACDEIMVKLDRPKGLIRYDSTKGLEHEKTRILRPRVFIYLLLMLIGAGVMIGALATRFKPVTLSVSRMTGAPYYLAEDTVRNNFMLRIINKRSDARSYVVDVVAEGKSLEVPGIDEPIPIPGNGETTRTLVVVLPEDEFSSAFTLEVRVRELESDLVVTHETEFLGP